MDEAERVDAEAEALRERLLEAARRIEREKRMPKTAAVRTFIRVHFDVIERMHVAMTWEQIAEALAREGVRWGSGSRVSARDLRSLFCLVRAQLAAGGRRPPATTLDAGAVPNAAPAEPAPAPAEDARSKMLENLNMANRVRPPPRQSRERGGVEKLIDG